MQAKIDDYEIPVKFIRHVLPFIEGVRIVGEVMGQKDCEAVRGRLARLTNGTPISLDAISTSGERILGSYVISEVRIEEKKMLLDKMGLNFHIVMKRQ